MFCIEIRTHCSECQAADCFGAIIKLHSGHRIFALCPTHHFAHLRHMAGHHLAVFLFLHRSGGPDQLSLAVVHFQDDIGLQCLPADDRYGILIPTAFLSINRFDFIRKTGYFFCAPFADIFREVAVQ
ncbi:hypothetical protein SDC9_78848 [bioreactor metagenome]|uniref:Uncharacterized protein n=1 Tax=bioreactor metagenome TaxID=1076179 RepID=A0A644YUT2_9ZZZZ